MLVHVYVSFWFLHGSLQLSGINQITYISLMESLQSFKSKIKTLYSYMTTQRQEQTHTLDISLPLLHKVCIILHIPIHQSH